MRILEGSIGNAKKGKGQNLHSQSIEFTAHNSTLNRAKKTLINFQILTNPQSNNPKTPPHQSFQLRSPLCLLTSSCKKASKLPLNIFYLSNNNKNNAYRNFNKHYWYGNNQDEWVKSASLAAQVDKDEMEVVVVDLFDLFVEDGTSAVQEGLDVGQDWVGLVELHEFLQGIYGEVVVGGQVLGLVHHFVAEVLVKELDREVFSDEGFALGVEVLEKRVYQFFSSHLKTHSHLVLEVDLYVVAEIASYVYLDLKRGLDVGKDARLAIPLVGDFCSDVASFRAVVDMLAVLTKLEDRVVLPAIQALRKDISAIPIDHYLMILQMSRSVLSIMIQYYLQVRIKILISLVQLQLVPSDASLNQRLSLSLGVAAGQSMEKCKVRAFNPKARKWSLECLRLLHNYVIKDNILAKALLTFYFSLTIMDNTAKVTGSRILQDRTSLKAYVSGNNASFKQRIATITKKDYSRIKKLGIFEHSNDPNPHIFYFHASKYESDDRNDVEEFIIEELHHFYNNFQCSYSVAYIHSNFVDFIVFRRFIEKWPEHFFQKLRRIYIVAPSFMVKIIEKLSIGTFYRLCDQFFMNISDLGELKEHDEATMSLIGETRKTPTTMSKINAVKVIENGLHGKILQDYKLYMAKYPKIVLRLLKRMLRQPTQLQLQGIFRKSCDSDELQKLQRQIMIKNWSAIDKEQDILTVCGCLKKLLNNLKLPLFNYKIYDLIIVFPGGDETTLIKKIINQMEYINQKVFVLLLVFLTDYVISQMEHNKMSGYNLSVVFGPCFFRPKEYDLSDLIYSGKFVKVLVNCFERPAEVIEEGELKLAKGILSALRNGDLDIDNE